MKIYLAARYGRREELLGYAAELAADGHTIVSRWIDGAHEARGCTDDGITLNGMTLDECARYADEDLDDIYNAEAFLVFTEPEGSPYSRGGRHVELGYAHGVSVPHIAVIGPRENIFHALPGTWHYETWEAFWDGREGMEP